MISQLTTSQYSTGDINCFEVQLATQLQAVLRLARRSTNTNTVKHERCCLSVASTALPTDQADRRSGIDGHGANKFLFLYYPSTSYFLVKFCANYCGSSHTRGCEVLQQVRLFVRLSSVRCGGNWRICGKKFKLHDNIVTFRTVLMSKNQQ